MCLIRCVVRCSLDTADSPITEHDHCVQRFYAQSEKRECHDSSSINLNSASGCMMQQHRRHHLLKKQHAGSCIFRSRVFGQSPATDRGFRRCTGRPHGLVTKQRRCCEAASSSVAGIRACGQGEGTCQDVHRNGNCSDL